MAESSVPYATSGKGSGSADHMDERDRDEREERAA